METPDGSLSAECACHNDRVRREITVFRREKAPVFLRYEMTLMDPKLTCQSR